MNDDNTPRSTDGFLRTANQAAQPQRPSVLPAAEQARLMGDIKPEVPAASAIVHPNQPVQEVAVAATRTGPTQLPPIVDEPRPVVEPPDPDEPNQGMRDLISVLGVLVSALLLAFCLIFFVFQSYQVDGQSMERTLQHRDHLIIWKVNRTVAKITGGQYVPNRGDVIVFNEPADAEPGSLGNKQLIKRVIGLPGERVVYEGTKVTVYNKENPNGFDPDKAGGYDKQLRFNAESKDDRTLGNDEIYVSGDNRDASLDSRIIGPVKTDLIVGKMVVRILPLNTFKLF